MGKLLEHKGVVSAVGEKMVEVEFVVQSACAECKAKGMCGVDEGNRRFVTVYEPLAEYFSVGEEVIIGVAETVGMRAATWFYIVPFFVILGSLLVMRLLLNWSELVAGLSSLGFVVLYYVVLWIFRSRIEKEIVFKIRKI
jgi:sigma-E factor negative regulatory protein RseC